MLKNKGLNTLEVIYTNYPSKKIFTFYTNDIDFILETLTEYIVDISKIKVVIEKALKLKINNKFIIILNKKWINIQLRTLESRIKSNNIYRIKNKDYNASIILFGQYRIINS